MRIIELFAGTGSFSRVAEERGCSVFTVDINPKFKPNLVADVNTVFIKDLPFRPDVIWASPPCEEYSHAKRRGVRHMEEADKNVETVKQLIEGLKPTFWIIENPQTGLLKNREVVKGLPFVDVSYCKYGLPYRKQTRLWNNLEGWKPKPVCKKDCEFIIGDRYKKHIMSCGNGRRKYTTESVKLEDKYRVPPELCEDILSFIEEHL